MNSDISIIIYMVMRPVRILPCPSGKPLIF
nr:MAG TPA: hypothetical protein [Caudoviricetes sp.]